MHMVKTIKTVSPKKTKHSASHPLESINIRCPVIAVSYTHLDVYKRQACTHRKNHSERSLASDNPCWNYRYKDSSQDAGRYRYYGSQAAAVSYTHLIIQHLSPRCKLPIFRSLRLPNKREFDLPIRCV